MPSNSYPPIAPPTGGTPSLPGPGQPGPMHPGEFRPGSTPNFTTFGWANVGPPSALYVQRDDVLVLSVASQISVESALFNMRFLPAPSPRGGQPDSAAADTAKVDLLSTNIIVTEQQLVTLPAATRSNSKTVVLGEGYLLSVGVTATNAINRGQTFARALLIRGGGIQTFGAYALFADYVTAQAFAGWPGGRLLHPTEGPGFLHSVTVGNPAAGSDFILQPSPAQRWRVITLQAKMVIANAGSARTFEFQVLNGGNTTARMAANATGAINTTVQVNFSNSGTPSAAVTTDLYAQMPSTLVLGPSDSIVSVTGGIQAADQWSLISALVEEWIDQL